MTNKRISIGILAWNEEGVIARTIRSLFEQTLFSPDNPIAKAIEVVCVPNGCTDQTATLSRKILEECRRNCAHLAVQCRVCEVEAPGKSNAWNRFVHDFADPFADYVFVMDSDIWFTESDTCTRMLTALQEQPSAHFSIDRPVKDIAFRRRKNFIELISMGVTSANEAGPLAICGQFYCGRGDFVRRIWMPEGLTIEDSFLTYMARTSLCNSSPDGSRVVRASGAYHVFEAYTSIRDIYKHYKACVIGSTVNAILVEHLTANTGNEDAGAYIKRLTEERPDWFGQLVRERFAGNGWWVIPNPINLRRFRRLKGLSFRDKITRFPFAVVGFLMDAIVNVAANQAVKQSSTAYFWEKTRE